ncbi:UDP-sugar hydrolase [Polaribacter reichenbachii]|uniref:UDP-sugar hydrolase n=1 Tax=Polaribacter reichenbachii TaxID=996801 RepID=A0A1B8U4C3_9FLAO|nr:5'-nucleotidase [Polaribacter reichenbachii]APZ47443.1 UDP-sugar hydrolase [Polaribacter reichenbachii]AUC18082.1 UDP-sugar hydrolase [Polaribacter reichenbachii]OBY66693.1 UDP-sugar hydrolase [Polaribacter reichenbachii]
MKFTHFLCLFLLLASCKKTEQSVTKITGKNIKIDTTIVASEDINQIIKPYKEELTDDMQEPLTFAPIDLTKENIGKQSNLGNLLADLCIEMANPVFHKKTKKNIDFSMFNSGGIRAIIPKGVVTRERAFKVMPFENELVVVTLSGDKMEELIQYFIKTKAAHPLSQNIDLTIKGNDYTLKINGKPFDKSKSYSVLTTDYLQSGGDRMNFFKNPLKLTVLDYKMRDCIIDYFQKVDTLKTGIDNRIKLK